MKYIYQYIQSIFLFLFKGSSLALSLFLFRSQWKGGKSRERKKIDLTRSFKGREEGEGATFGVEIPALPLQTSDLLRYTLPCCGLTTHIWTRGSIVIICHL